MTTGLEARGLTATFGQGAGALRPVDGVSFDLRPGRTLCLVGESGSGKSLTALSLLGLLPPGAAVSGEVRLGGEALPLSDRRRMQAVRGARIAMIFQEPMTALNPAWTVGAQIAELARRHRGLSRAAAAEAAVAMLRRVGMPAPERRAGDYPHQLSGGMRQRALIAMALVNDPAVLLADEPTTALDVTIQAQILDLVRGLQEERGTAVLLITHDLGVVAECADEVAVMYAGRIVERAPAARLFAAPQHPYTIGLLGCLPRLDRTAGALVAIRGAVPPLAAMPGGCRFAPRCPFAAPRCAAEAPEPRPVAEGHEVACHLAPLLPSAAPAAA